MSGLERYDAIVIGGGPAGSSCAARLVQGGAKVAVLDREGFPRTKLCAGWVTPQAMADLTLDPAHYPCRFITFEQIVAHIKGMSFKLSTPQHSIRRYEFDDFLLQRSGAEVRRRNVKAIRRENGHYIVAEEFRCDYLVGAGGTRCPVYRSVFRERNPRAKELQATTYEHEFPFEWSDARCHLWFFDKGLPGYAWYVPKEKGYLNCGIGGMADKLKARGVDIKTHWRHFTEVLRSKGFVVKADYAPRGYSYYLRGEVDVVRIDNAFITGDAAGLATRDLCEGIGPAIRSGQRAADSILTGTEYRLEDLSSFSAEHAAIRSLLEYMFIRRKTRPRSRAVARASAQGS